MTRMRYQGELGEALLAPAGPRNRSDREESIGRPRVLQRKRGPHP